MSDRHPSNKQSPTRRGTSPSATLRLLTAYALLVASLTSRAQGKVVFQGGIESTALSASRMVRVWVPPSYASATERRYPVLYVHDGQNAFSAVGTNVAFGWGAWELDLTAGKLIQAGRLEEIILVSVDCSAKRYEEYRGPARRWTGPELAAMDPRRRPPAPGDDSAYEDYGKFLIGELKPRIDREYRTLPDPAHTGLLGSSLGGLCSLALAWDHSDIFGLAASLSGAFQVEGTNFLTGVLRTYRGAPKPLRLYLDSGVMSLGGGDDGCANTRAVAQELQRIGWKPGVNLMHYIDTQPLPEADLVRLNVRRDKWKEAATSQHNELYWRVRAGQALEFLFPADKGGGNGGDAKPPQHEQAELRLRILDATARHQVPCTVRLVDANNRLVTEGEGLRDGFRSSGALNKILPGGLTRLRVTRGPEYKAVEKEVTLAPHGTTSLDVVLERQVDLRQRGWFAGDSHAHMIHGERTIPVSFDHVALSARAEDLQYFSLAHAWALENPTPERLAAELDRRSTADCALTWNLEAPKNYFLGDAGRCLGHGWNLGMRGRTSDGADVIALLLAASAADYESSKPSFANFESHALIHAQGGKVFYTHPARWWRGPWGGEGGYPKQANMRVSNMAVELPLDVLAGPTFDGMDVITGSGELAANEKSFQLWCLLLNHGYRLAATASSDACFDRPGGATPGAARVYTLLDGPFSVPAVAQATAQGRTFVTTGPLLLASVEGQPPGSAFPADGNTRLLRIEAWASGADTGGLARVEILRNGQPFQKHQLDGKQTLFLTNQPISESQTAWYCVRSFGQNEQRHRAISGAFFFDERPWRPPAPVQARVSVQVLDADSGGAVNATLTEVAFLATQPRAGTPHRVRRGPTTLIVPATTRLRAEAPGFEPFTLSPFFDNPQLVETITHLTDQDLLNWQTFERVRSLLGNVTLTFRLKKAHR